MYDVTTMLQLLASAECSFPLMLDTPQHTTLHKTHRNGALPEIVQLDLVQVEVDVSPANAADVQSTRVDLVLRIQMQA